MMTLVIGMVHDIVSTFCFLASLVLWVERRGWYRGYLYRHLKEENEKGSYNNNLDNRKTESRRDIECVYMVHANRSVEKPESIGNRSVNTS